MSRIIAAIWTAMLSMALAQGQTAKLSAEMESIIGRAENANTSYTEAFKDLSAEELKIFESYDKNGDLKETRRIRSVFVVYQSPKDGTTGELRNVIEFNGKLVERQDKDLTEFFEKVAPSDSIREEMTQIQFRSKGL